MSTYGDRLPAGRDNYHQITPLRTDGFYIHQKCLEISGPANFESLQISTVCSNGRDYVSGLRINGASRELGYHRPRTSQTFQLTPAHGNVCALLLYMDRVGIRGFALVTDDGSATGMIPDGKTRLELYERVLRLAENTALQINDLVVDLDVRVLFNPWSQAQTCDLTPTLQAIKLKSVSIYHCPVVG